MKLLSGIDQIRQLPAHRQQRFERFYQLQYRYHVLPLLADVFLILAFIGTLLLLAGLALNQDAPAVLATYVLYTLILTALIVAHRLTALRRAAHRAARHALRSGGRHPGGPHAGLPPG